MSHIQRIPERVAAGHINTSFYGVFCDRGVDLIKSVIFDTSPAAYEYMETAYPAPEHPSLYLRNYRYSVRCLSVIKDALFLQNDSVLKPDTMDGLMGANYEKEHNVDAALWRIWTFCEVFGGESGREKDHQSQMAWLQNGSSARVPHAPACFGRGNGEGLSVPELLLITEPWDALSPLLQAPSRPRTGHPR